MIENPSLNNSVGPELFPASSSNETQRYVGNGTVRVQSNIPTADDGWSSPRVGMWWLDSTQISDVHPFDEINVVIRGKLIVEAQGHTVTALPGDVVRVPAGTSATYKSHGTTHMVYIYAANPSGAPSEVLS